MEGNEILAVVDSVSNEKGLDKDSIFEAIAIASKIESLSKPFSLDTESTTAKISLPSIIFTHP